MTDARFVHLHPEERAAAGRAARKAFPRSSHAELGALRSPEDAVALVEDQNVHRLQWLVPVRRGRMATDAFSFFRGAAGVMAADLSDNALSGLGVQVGGDAHLANFGAYASPERRLLFDANDFDETLAGPWEWDVKRLATSFTIAARHHGLGRATQGRITSTCVAAYRAAIANYGRLGVQDVWYDSADVGVLEAMGRQLGGHAVEKRVAEFGRRAESRTSREALRRLTVEEGGKYRIRSNPPVLFPLSDLEHHPEAGDLASASEAAFESYRDSLADDRRVLLQQYTPVDVGVKVVGVGSVGTRCLIVLLEGRDRSDPLFLQMKEATASVLEPFLAPSPYGNHGRRVVEGQRLVQAASDIFLGWATVPGAGDFYVRQLRDWKGSVDLDGLDADGLALYAHLCGWTLARGHARSGDPIAISAYLGKGHNFDRAVTEFACRYADRNELYHEAFAAAIEDGHLEATEGV